MTSTLAITINVVLDIAIPALLVLVMTSASRLTPQGGQAGPAPERARAARRRPSRAGEPSRRLRPVLD
jgi:hypothetical protein